MIANKYEIGSRGCDTNCHRFTVCVMTLFHHIFLYRSPYLPLYVARYSLMIPCVVSVVSVVHDFPSLVPH